MIYSPIFPLKTPSNVKYRQPIMKVPMIDSAMSARISIRKRLPDIGTEINLECQ